MQAMERLDNIRKEQGAPKIIVTAYKQIVEGRQELISGRSLVGEDISVIEIPSLLT